MAKAKDQLQVLAFSSSGLWASWLAEHHSHSNGIWLRIYKKDSGINSVTYAEALDEALCYGWIDGQKKPYDKQSWLQKFTRRGAKSGWSKINTEHAERLIKSGKMKEAGLAAIRAAQGDGRWTKAYDSQRNAVVPDDFLTRLNKNKKASAFFKTLNKANLYAIAYRLQTAKKMETREKRMEMIIKMLAKAEKFH